MRRGMEQFGTAAVLLWLVQSCVAVNLVFLGVVITLRLVRQACVTLEKALVQDSGYTEAVCLLAELIGRKQEYQKAIEL